MHVEQIFTLRFTGEAVDNHSIDVRLLAPALIAAADMMTTAHDVLRPEDPKPSVEIRATAPGSFLVELAATASGGFIDNLLDGLTGREATASANMLAYVGAAIGAISFATRKKGRRIAKETPVGKGTVKFEFTDGTTVTVPEDSKILANNATFREHGRRLASSTEEQGIDGIEIQVEGQDPAFLAPGDADAFDASIRDYAPTEHEDIFQIKSLALAGNYRWRLSEGEGRSFTALLKDKEFQKRINLGMERFGSGDLLRARVRETKYIDSDGNLHTNTVIMKVLEHICMGEQGTMNFEETE